MLELLMDPRRHYRILEIDRSATLDEARQAYRDLIAVWHPDRYTHNPRLQAKAVEKMKRLNAAFEVVSRHILENGSAKNRPSENRPRKAPSAAGAADSPGGEMDRSAAWAQTEARLEALARAKKIAAARKAAEAGRQPAAAENEEKQAAETKARLETVNRARAREKAAADKARLEKRLARERVWAETEQKLRALKLAKEKADAEKAHPLPGSVQDKDAFGWYLKQGLIGVGILLIAFAGNAIQTFIHVSFTAMLITIGSGLLTWWIVAKVKASGRSPK